MITTLIAAMINIALNFVFIPSYGIWGAIIGTVIAYFVIAMMRLINVLRYIKIDFKIPVLAMNCILIIFQAIFVSSDCFKYLVSSITLVAFLIVNITTVKTILGFIKVKICKKH